MAFIINFIFSICGGLYIGQLIRKTIRHFRRPKKLDPINVIQGMIFPMPDDPRWEQRWDYSTHYLILDKIRIPVHSHDKLKVNGVIIDGPDATRYITAVRDAYHASIKRTEKEKADRYLTGLLKRDIDNP